MTYENFVKAGLLKYAYREGARYGGHQVIMAVAQVLANRVRAGWESGDWLQVIENAPNYLGTVHERGTPIDARSLPFRQLLQRIDDVYYGTAGDDDTCGALYYAELDNVNRDWFTDNILSDPTSHPRLANVQFVTFFG